jgi:hypothetical protein
MGECVGRSLTGAAFGIQAAAVSCWGLSPFSGRTGSPASHFSISSERHTERPPAMRERGNMPARIQAQMVNTGYGENFGLGEEPRFAARGSERVGFSGESRLRGRFCFGHI